MSNWKKLVPRGFVLAVLMALQACAVGPFNGLSSDPMRGSMPFCSQGQCSADQWVIATVVANLTNDQFDPQLSSPAESFGAEGAAYGVGYGLGGLSQEAFYVGADGGAAAGVAGVTGLFGGGINGLISWSYSHSGAIGGGSDKVLRDWEAGKAVPPEVLAVYPNISELCVGLHVEVSYVRTKNRTKDHLPDGWHGLKSTTLPSPAPKFSGPRAGSQAPAPAQPAAAPQAPASAGPWR